jgi:hypothetical protein
MPRLGLFAEVVQGGAVSAGDLAAVLECIPRQKCQVVVIATPDADKKEVRERFNQCMTGLEVSLYEIAVSDNDRESLTKAVFRYIKGRNIDVIVPLGFAPGSLPANRHFPEPVAILSGEVAKLSGLADRWRSSPPLASQGGNAKIVCLLSVPEPSRLTLSTTESV